MSIANCNKRPASSNLVLRHFSMVLRNKIFRERGLKKQGVVSKTTNMFKEALDKAPPPPKQITIIRIYKPGEK